MSTPPSPTHSTFSSSSCEDSSNTSKARRTSRFVEGEANVLSDMQSLHLANYNAIMAEMDSYDQERTTSTPSKAQPQSTTYSTMSLGRKFGTKHRRGGSTASELNLPSSTAALKRTSSPPGLSGLGVEMWARRSLETIRDEEKGMGGKIKKGLRGLAVAKGRGVKVETYPGT